MADLTLSLKPDLEAATQRWLAFWAHELTDRPVTTIRTPREGVERVGGPPYMAGLTGEWDALLDQILANLQATYWAGDAIPHYVPSFGPDQMAAFAGARLVTPEDSGNYGTNWVEACIDDWAKQLPLRVDDDNYWWSRMIAFYEALAAKLDGHAVLAHLDLHSNFDLLLALRGGERLCLDLLDTPDLVDAALDSANALYAPVYDRLYEAGRMDHTGTLGWVTAYHPERTNTIQCDFAALIGPRQFDRWAAPALAAEAEHLGRCVYHLDGPECLVHLESICAVPGLECIQWTTGARNAAFPEWIDLLQRIQSLGVAVWIPCSAAEIPFYHRQLKPHLVWYDAWAPSEREADEMLEWLVANT